MRPAMLTMRPSIDIGSIRHRYCPQQVHIGWHGVYTPHFFHGPSQRHRFCLFRRSPGVLQMTTSDVDDRMGSGLMKSFLFPVAAGTLALGFALAPVPASATISRAVCMNAWNQCQATGSPTACAVV